MTVGEALDLYEEGAEIVIEGGKITDVIYPR